MQMTVLAIMVSMKSKIILSSEALIGKTFAMKNLNTSQIIKVRKTAPDSIDLRKKSLGCHLMTKREIASSEKTSILLDIHIKQM